MSGVSQSSAQLWTCPNASCGTRHPPAHTACEVCGFSWYSGLTFLCRRCHDLNDIRMPSCLHCGQAPLVKPSNPLLGREKLRACGWHYDPEADYWYPPVVPARPVYEKCPGGWHVVSRESSYAYMQRCLAVPCRASCACRRAPHSEEKCLSVIGGIVGADVVILVRNGSSHCVTCWLAGVSRWSWSCAACLCSSIDSGCCVMMGPAT